MEWCGVPTARQERRLRPVSPCSYRGRWGGEDGALRLGVRNKPVRMKERGEGDSWHREGQKEAHLVCLW